MAERPYVCGDCGAAGVKLWRAYATFAPELRCAPCAARVQGITLLSLDADGRVTYAESRHKTVAIAWYVPAVRHPDGDGWWGYLAIPEAGWSWWRALPAELTHG